MRRFSAIVGQDGELQSPILELCPVGAASAPAVSPAESPSVLALHPILTPKMQMITDEENVRCSSNCVGRGAYSLRDPVARSSAALARGRAAVSSRSGS